MTLKLGDIINGEVAYVGVGDQAGTIWVMREVQKYVSEMERMPVGNIQTVERDGVLIMDNQEEASPLQHAYFNLVCAKVSLQNSICRGGHDRLGVCGVSASARAIRAARYLMSLGTMKFSLNNVTADYPKYEGGTWHRRVFGADGAVRDDRFITDRAVIKMAVLNGWAEGDTE